MMMVVTDVVVVVVVDGMERYGLGGGKDLWLYHYHHHLSVTHTSIIGYWTSQN